MMLGAPAMKTGRARSLVAALALFVAMAVLLTGCSVQFGLDTKVEPDGSGTIGVRLAADKELQDQLSSATESLGGLDGLGDLENLGDIGDLGFLGPILGGLGDLGILENLGTLGTILGLLGDVSSALPTSVDDLFDTILGQIPGDWQVERGTDSSGTRWISLTRAFSDLEELKQIMSEGTISKIAPMDEFYITQDDGFFGTKTVFSTSLDPDKIMSETQEGSSSLPADLLEKVLAIQYRLTLPGEIGDNNADMRDGNTLTWNVGFSGKTDMYAESTVTSWGAIIGVIVGAVVVVALIALAVILILRRRRRKSPPSQPEAAALADTEAQPGVGQTEESLAPAEVQPDTAQTEGSAADTDTTEIRPGAALVPPPVDEVPSVAPGGAAIAATGAMVAGAAAESPVPAVEQLPAAAEPPEVEPAPTLEELPAAEAAPELEEPPTEEPVAEPKGASAAEEAAPTTDGAAPTTEESAPATAGGAPEPAEAPMAAEEAVADETSATPAVAGTVTDVTEALRPDPTRPPTPVPLRPSRISAQNTGGEAVAGSPDQGTDEASVDAATDATDEEPGPT
jgi:hypothetical protein